MGNPDGALLDNALSKKPQVVQIQATDKAFKTDGCQPWQQNNDATPAPEASGPQLQAGLGHPQRAARPQWAACPECAAAPECAAVAERTAGPKCTPVFECVAGTSFLIPLDRMPVTSHNLGSGSF